ncbi:MAG: hypothetical protein AAGB32_02185 [Pseudomonadota bacterium]
MRKFFAEKVQLSKGMKAALIASVAFHLGVLIIGTVGLPYITKPPNIPQQPLAVEIVDISEITTTNKKPQKAPPKPKNEPPPKVEKEVKAPPKVEAKKPPKVKPIEKPPEPPKEETKKPEPKTPPPPSEKLAEVKPEPKPKKEKKEEDKKEATVSEEDFLSVLKNLQDTEPTGEVNPEGDEKTDPDQSPLAKFSERLSATEVDLIARNLNMQFASCWNLMAGARNAEDITVTINLTVRPDRTVQSAKIVDQWRYTQDTFYRAAADTALRAINHPNCEVLDLPEDKYNLWKDLTFNFNPSAQL